MKICFCENCRYMFPASPVPGRCPDCGGKRLKAEARAVTVGGKSLHEVKKGMAGELKFLKSTMGPIKV